MMSRLKWLLIVVLAAVMLVYGTWTLSRSRTFQVAGRLVSHGTPVDSTIALTFDDGPTKTFTGEILATLADHRVQATFFSPEEKPRRVPKKRKPSYAPVMNSEIIPIHTDR